MDVNDAGQARYLLSKFYGYDRLIQPPFIYGEQPKPYIVEHYSYDGKLVSRTEHPPALRIIY